MAGSVGTNYMSASRTSLNSLNGDITTLNEACQEKRYHIKYAISEDSDMCASAQFAQLSFFFNKFQYGYSILNQPVLLSGRAG